jgi:hypothetical protein
VDASPYDAQTYLSQQKYSNNGSYNGAGNGGDYYARAYDTY